jgi:ribosomal-protein-alanine N-acetyltransferase
VNGTEEWTFEQLTSDRDLNQVLAIERASFTSPWTWDMLKWELENAPTSRIYVLRGADGVIHAFCSVWIVADEIHVNNLAVAPAWRRLGMGRGLLERVLAEAAAGGAHEATLEVRRSNEAALRLYHALGFVVAGVRRNYYTNPVEDALILWKTGRNPGAGGPRRPA